EPHADAWPRVDRSHPCHRADLQPHVSRVPREPLGIAERVVAALRVTLQIERHRLQSGRRTTRACEQRDEFGLFAGHAGAKLARDAPVIRLQLPAGKCKSRADIPQRSEERRVGKECRSRWSPDHEKKKKEKNRRIESRKDSSQIMPENSNRTVMIDI